MDLSTDQHQPTDGNLEETVLYAVHRGIRHKQVQGDMADKRA